ncbi:MAG: ABC transporter ATP-binding protein/permease [Bacteroidaceae bacterium]|nr:ABC transporter ATP-binding protein/permease [Bacteroidaceae bacterium]
MSLLTLIRKISPFVRPYKWLVVATLILTLIGSLIAQVNAVVLDWTVDTINGLIVHNGSGDIGEQHFAWSTAARILTTITAILLGKEVLSVIISYAQNYYGERMRVHVSRDLAQTAVDRILSYRMAFFSRSGNEAGRLQSRIDQGVGSLSTTVQSVFIDLLPLFTSAFLALVLMFLANVYVGLAALFIVPIYIYITIRQARRLKGWRQEMRQHRELKSHGIVNIIESINVIKSFNREGIESTKQLDIQTRLTDNQLKTRKVMLYFDGWKRFVQQIGTVIIIILTAYLVLIDYPGMTIGKIMYHVMLFANVTAPITQLQRVFDTLNDALIYAEGYFSVVEAEGEVEESGAYRPKSIEGRLHIEGVDFTYPNGTKALHNINMDIEPGKITAFVGLSGAGKSTIVNLLDKFYTPDCGTITLDGVDIKEYDTQYLRENIGLVLQKNHIFDGTIEDNIRYGKPDATFQEVEDAARSAYIYDQVMKLPQGFQSQATMLSGGQQQRIAIARMFLKNPPIIFLDEPTASLDAIATEQIKNSLDAIKQGRTVILISHSISQIIDSDLIYALRDGRVEQSGNPDELYHKGGIYKEIVDASARSLNVDKLAHLKEV